MRRAGFSRDQPRSSACAGFDWRALSPRFRRQAPAYQRRAAREYPRVAGTARGPGRRRILVGTTTEVFSQALFKRVWRGEAEETPGVVTAPDEAVTARRFSGD